MKKILSLILLLMIFSTVYAFAHGMSLRLEGPGVLIAEYDGGGFSPRMVVTLYDKEGTKLAEGPVDSEGKYHFDQTLPVANAVVEDGLGHRATYEKGVFQQDIPKLPVVIGVFIVVGIIMVYYERKIRLKNKGNTEQ